MTDDRNPPHATSFGFRSVDPASKEGLVRGVFNRVAGRYDLMNDLMSAGLHRAWKDHLIGWLAPSRAPNNLRLVDVAGGTGDVASRFLERAGTGASAVVCDINEAMLSEGSKRNRSAGMAGLSFACGSAEALPFPDNAVDAYTIAFGIRNVTRIDRALSEACRVLRPGGRFMCLEFSHVEVPGLDDIYDAYSFGVIPALGEMVAGDRESYQYLVESIRRFPEQKAFARMVEEAGFRRVAFRNLTGGVVAIHSGWRL